MSKLFIAAMCAGMAAAGSLPIQDINGQQITPLAPSGLASILFFVTNDCPIANFYAPEIQQICSSYQAKGVSCSLVYIDPTVDAVAVKKHLADFRYGPAIQVVRDEKHLLVDAIHATVTPEVVVVGHDGAILYRGRIDNFYAGLGKSRRQATQHDLRAALDEIVEGKPVSHPQTEPVGCYIPPLSVYQDHK